MKNPSILKSLIRSKVLVLDGAMGTMIQKLKFDESDYRGERFKNYDILLKGNNRTNLNNFTKKIISSAKIPSSVKVIIDVDPYTFS